MGKLSTTISPNAITPISVEPPPISITKVIPKSLRPARAPKKDKKASSCPNKMSTSRPICFTLFKKSLLFFASRRALVPNAEMLLLCMAFALSLKYVRTDKVSAMEVSSSRRFLATPRPKRVVTRSLYTVTREPSDRSATKSLIELEPKSITAALMFLLLFKKFKIQGFPLDILLIIAMNQYKSSIRLSFFHKLLNLFLIHDFF